MTRYVTVACVVVLSLGVSTSVTTGEEIAIQVSPSTINLAQQGEWVTIHADIAYGSVDRASLTLNGEDVSWTKSDNQGYLVAKFDVNSVKDLLRDFVDQDVALTLSGMDIYGNPFSGTSMVRVVDNSDNKKK